MSRGVNGCLGGLFSLLMTLFSGRYGWVGFVLGLVIVYILVQAALQAIPWVLFALRLLLLAGALFGLGITVRNYALALYHNIKPEKVTP